MSKRLGHQGLNSTTWSRSKGPIQIMKRSLNATIWSRSKGRDWSVKAINRGANQEKTQHKENTILQNFQVLQLPYSSILLWGSKCVQRCFKKVQAHSSLQVIKLATRLFSYSFILSFERREFYPSPHLVYTSFVFQVDWEVCLKIINLKGKGYWVKPKNSSGGL